MTKKRTWANSTWSSSSVANPWQAAKKGLKGTFSLGLLAGSTSTVNLQSWEAWGNDEAPYKHACFPDASLESALKVLLCQQHKSWLLLWQNGGHGPDVQIRIWRVAQQEQWSVYLCMCARGACSVHNNLSLMKFRVDYIGTASFMH